MSQKNEQFEEMTGLLNRAIPIIKKVLTDFNQIEDVRTEIAVYQNLLQRLYYCIQSVECLLQRFNHDVNFKFPIGILIRNGLLDFITAGYLFEKGHRANNFSLEFAKINHQFVSSEVEFCTNRLSKNEITKEVFQKELIELKKWYPQNFNSDKNGIPQIKKNNSISPKKMAESLKHHSNAHNLYHYYSQYEHYGIFSKLMIDAHPEYDFDKLKVAFWYVFLGVILCFERMKIPVDYKNIINEVRDKILEMPEVCTFKTIHK